MLSDKGWFILAQFFIFMLLGKRKCTMLGIRTCIFCHSRKKKIKKGGWFQRVFNWWKLCIQICDPNIDMMINTLDKMNYTSENPPDVFVKTLQLMF